MLTYAVYDANGAPAVGIRCVQLRWHSTLNPPPVYTNLLYSFFWYGEGAWGDATYRQLGAVAVDSEFPQTVMAADIYGNGEAVTGGIAENFEASIVGSWPAPSEIHLSGGRGEIWKLVQSVNYTPLPRPLTCGPNFDTYVVANTPGTQGGGLRCSVKNVPGIWLGIGDWDGGTYFHLGWEGWTGWGGVWGAGAVDLCDPAFGDSCGLSPSGSRSISNLHPPPQPQVRVTGAWDEVWSYVNVATYSPTVKAPSCNTTGLGCTSGAMLKGRGPMGPEANAPNTVDGCADGTVGAYYVDESIDSLSVSTLDGASMLMGKTVRVDARVWAYSAYTEDYLDLYYAANANSPSWTLIGTLQPATNGESTISGMFTLPYGSTTQIVRAQLRYGGTTGTCTSGPYNDRDDLVFAVGERDRLLPDEALLVNQYLRSQDGRWTLFMQDDGNLVLFDSAWNPIWSTKTNGHLDIWGVRMQGDGNLVVYNVSGQPLWASNTDGKGGTSLVLQNDANVVIYTSAGQAVWATRTCCR